MTSVGKDPPVPRQEKRDAQEFRVRVGARVRELRLHRGITQAQLAEASGLSRGYLSSIERARVNATMIPVYRIAAALDVVPMVLFTGANDDALSREFDKLRYLPAREATQVLEDWARRIQRSFTLGK
ncbi:helix-turn-helix domain-containing protein [Polyangium sorediatum]|uniref:Helix-turn-helix domain-containing protein n=1 Tax=Polyangium sorediatum TaxID=889274 RepID=A0ABT6PBI2_9BACT|nr:helix-turn-helix domain-containing protein [Polyangium sorediatum]MDI1437627.1 helix-turn-helix domain-containing protein [Polyangium sorediatum]